jgi:murein DD-endopeptidase MepM/ murein hydrolase activator NlpD
MSEELESKTKVKIFNLLFPVFRLDKSSREYYTIISAPLGVINGEYPLEVMRENKTLSKLNVSVSVRKELQTQELLDAPEVNVLPQNAKIVQRVAEEDMELKKEMIVQSPQRFWEGDFIQPVSVKINSRFGIYRIYSKHLRRRTHWGVDYHTPIGTKVRASAEGVVSLAKEFYFPGKTILIDHGNGLFTGYSHLSKMKVKIGDRVKKGEVIGNSGMSGKVTGPHLHWFAVNSRVKVDPLSLLKIKFEKKSK